MILTRSDATEKAYMTYAKRKPNGTPRKKRYPKAKKKAQKKA